MPVDISPEAASPTAAAMAAVTARVARGAGRPRRPSEGPEPRRAMATAARAVFSDASAAPPC